MSRACSQRPSTSFRKLFAFETLELRRLLAGIQISESIDRTIINDNGRNYDYYDVSLESPPTSDVTIQILTDNPLVQVNSLQLDPTQLVFTPNDWSPKRVFVSALDQNQLVTGPQASLISHQVSTLDPNYQDSVARDIAVTVIDTDSQLALTWYDQELMEGELQFTFLDVLFPPGYTGPQFDVSYDTTQIFLSGIGGGTQTIRAINDGIEEGVQDIPLNFIPNGQLPAGFTAPQAIVRVTDAVTPQFTGFQISGGQAQRSIVNSLTLTFSTEIFVQPNLITLTNTSNNSTAPLSMTVGNDRKSLNIFYGENFAVARTLADGNYELVVPQDAITQARSNLPLAQEVRLGATDGLFRLFGDLNGNGTIDELEVDTFNQAFGSSIGSNLYNPDLDEQNDGIIGDDDLASFRKIQLSTNTVAEDASVGTPIGSLSAFSLLGPAVSYEVVSVDGSTTNLPFSVQDNNLIVAGSLDFESNRLRQVKVKATTEAGVATFGDVVVQLLNVNENSSSPIQLTNDQVLENYTGPIGNLFIPDSSDSWQFSLSTGAGDYDNALFEIQGDQLSILEAPDYELRDNYSVRVLAQSGTQQIEAAITIDITPVDEFTPTGFVFWTEQYGEANTIPYLVENSPVGQPATRIRVIDQDRGELYTFSGFFGDLAEVQGDAFVPIREINYEAIAAPFSILNFVTAVSSNGVTYSNGGNTSVIVDVNDAPIAALPIGDRAYFAGEQNTFSISQDTFFDEDTGDYLTISASIAGEPLPPWLTFNSENLEFISNPTFFTTGSFVVEVRATDSQGASAIATFTLQINPLPSLTVQGTAGNDLFQLTRLNVPIDSWQVQRNGQTVFSGSLSNYIVSFAGGGGNDRVVVRGSDQANTFDLFEDHLKIEQTRVITDSVEQFDIRGRSGNDLLSLFGLPDSSAANRTLPTSFAFFGDSGQDKIQSQLGATQWTVTGNNSGNIAGVLSFTSVESLVGGIGDDTFTIESNTFPSIDGDAGYNTFRRVQQGGQPQLEISSLSPFAGQLNGTTLRNLSRIDLGTANGTVTGPTASAEPVVGWYLDSNPNTLQVSGGQSIELVGFSRLVGRDSQDFFDVFGSTNSWTIDGGGGADRLALPLFNTQLNLRNSSATGVSSFRNIETFAGSGSSSSIVGPNRDTDWTFDNGSVLAQWTGQPGIALNNFGSIQGGSGRDTFYLSTEVEAAPYNFPVQIHGGGGKDTIQSFTNPQFALMAIWNLFGLGSGAALLVNFESIENLVAGTDFDQFTFLNALANSQWFDSLSTTATPGFTLLKYAGSAGINVNLQNKTASGLIQWQGIDVFNGSDGEDLVIGTNDGRTWTIYLDGEFATDNTYLLQGFETIQGGTGNDTMAFNGVAADPSKASRVLGGAGIDTLSFARTPVPVTVSLLAGTTSLFDRGIGQFENVIGTDFDDVIEGNNGDNVLTGLIGNDLIRGLGGNDVLLGASGNDTLYGGTGRDLLLGGSGSDWLYGGNGEDIVISGQSSALLDETAFEDGIRNAAIQAVMAEWTSNRNYALRITRLRSGVGAGNAVALNAATIQTDDELDRVFGEADDDWFWIGTEDIDNDRLNRERVN